MSVSDWIHKAMQAAHDEIDHLKKLATKWEGRAVVAAETLAADAKPFAKQVQTTLSAEAHTIVTTELNAALSAAMSAGGWAAVGPAIAATVPALITKLELDGNELANNVLHGLAAFELAKITGKAA